MDKITNYVYLVTNEESKPFLCVLNGSIETHYNSLPIAVKMITNNSFKLVGKIKGCVNYNDIKTFDEFVKYSKILDRFISINKNNEIYIYFNDTMLEEVVVSFCNRFNFINPNVIKDTVHTTKNNVYVLTPADVEKAKNKINETNFYVEIKELVEKDYKFDENPVSIYIITTTNLVYELKVPKGIFTYKELFKVYGLNTNLDVYRFNGGHVFCDHLQALINRNNDNDIKQQFYNLNLSETNNFKKIIEFYDYCKKTY